MWSEASFNGMDYSILLLLHDLSTPVYFVYGGNKFHEPIF